MSIEEINDLVKRYDSLSLDEKEKLKNAILNNEEARNIALRGAIIGNNMQLATYLTLHK